MEEIRGKKSAPVSRCRYIFAARPGRKVVFLEQIRDMVRGTNALQYPSFYGQGVEFRDPITAPPGTGRHQERSRKVTMKLSILNQRNTNMSSSTS